MSDNTLANAAATGDGADATHLEVVPGNAPPAAEATPTDRLNPVEPLLRPEPTAGPPATGPGLPTAEQIAAWQTKAAKADEHYDRYVRTAADFDNFRKRAARERQDAVKFANEGLLTKLVPVLDNLEMALAAAGNAPTATVESLRTGVTMIGSQLKGVLVDAGLEEIDAAGQPFDPNLHEAVAQHDSADVPEGQVLQQLRKGYKYRERLLRPATVIVARKPATLP